jgi:hypothetical protein
MEKELEKLFEGISKDVLSEDVKKNLITLIETKVSEKVNTKIVELDEEFETFKKKEADKLEETSVEYVDKYLIEKIDSFLDKVSDQWLLEHTVEVDNGIKSELYEKLVGGMKGVLKENQIEEEAIQEQTDILVEKDKLQEDYNKIFSENEKLEDDVLILKSVAKFNEITVALTESEKGKVKQLCEDYDIDDLDAFGAKVKTLTENISKFISDEEKELNENVDPNVDGDGIIKDDIKTSDFTDYGIDLQ